MHCKNCYTELAEAVDICPECGYKGMVRKTILPRPVLWVALAFILCASLTIIILLFPWSPFKDKVTSSPLGDSPEHLFYLKDNSIYHTYANQIEPYELIPGFHTEEARPAPIFLSGDGSWLFYPMGPRDNADLYAYQFNSDREHRFELASKVAVFTTNQDSGRMYYLSEYELYSGNFKGFEAIDILVKRFYTNEAGDWVLYLTNDDSLYLKKGKHTARRLDEQVGLRFVSHDLKTIYYRKEGSLFLVKDGKDIRQVYEGSPSVSIPRLSYVYENGDSYFTYNSSLYYYSHSEGVTKLIINNLSYHYAAHDDSYLYPYRTLYGGSNPPIIICQDQNSDIFVCRGGEIIKKITGGSLFGASFDPEGKGFYYLVSQNMSYDTGDLFYISIEGSDISESTQIASGVANPFYVGDTFLYFKNMDDIQGDMYIDEKFIDSGVYAWAFSWSDTAIDTSTFLYLKNTKDYYNRIVNQHFSMDTLMLYQDGKTIHISDNVTDFEILGDRIIYLKIDDSDSDNGTLHLYKLNGEDQVIDTEINAIIRPTTNREYSGEIDPAYEEGFYYLGDY